MKPSRTLKMAVLMDPFDKIKVDMDSTLVVMDKAQKRGYEIRLFTQADMVAHDRVVWAKMHCVEVLPDQPQWCRIINTVYEPLSNMDVVLMRKDPPFDMEYIYTTYLLELVESAGTLIVNKPSALRNFNEKFSILNFPHCTVPGLITRDADQLLSFLDEHTDIMLKPLGEMGGTGVFRVRKTDPNVNVIIETLTHNGSRFITAQQYIPAITQGDKRILILGGKPIPFSLARFAKPGETRANLYSGGSGKSMPLTAREQAICDQIGPFLLDNGILFAGIDVIGGYVTEINITSPGCLKQLELACGLDIAGALLDVIEGAVKR